MFSDPLLPGGTLGVLGGGQLGRMLAAEAKRMGYRVHVFSPSGGGPAAQLSSAETVADYEDEAALGAFAEAVDRVTVEFENIPAAALEFLEKQLPVHPGPNVLHITQHRAREKTFLREHGFPVAPFRLIENVSELGAALTALGSPAILKTAGFGYDGKGQARVSSQAEAEAAFAELGGQACVLEALIAFDREVSVVAARSQAGEAVCYSPTENHHENHILSLSSVPAELSPGLKQDARQITLEVMEALEVVGVMCAEFFVTPSGLILNELAPRPHNSGHLTLEACEVSQFEQQLRAVCGLPLGETGYRRPAAMLNLLGDLWQNGEPNWAAALSVPGVRLHLYGKTGPRPGRKMGHLSALGESAAAARSRVLQARAALAAS